MQKFSYLRQMRKMLMLMATDFGVGGPVGLLSANFFVRKPTLYCTREIGSDSEEMWNCLLSS